MTFILSIFSYSCGLIVDAFLIFIALFQIISLDEMKNDYRNPIDLCQTLNPLVLPEYIAHTIITVLFIISGHWLSAAVNVPLMLYHIHRYEKRPLMSDPGIYDATTILQVNELSVSTRESWTKLVFYFVTFLYYLFALIYVLIQNV
ncbi:unnamed protein product [Oppiella nova]|uniref:Uncharacterized protein n=1 Tax=Oppiella nova TaxID=334625 RepID=A0A7R9LVW3_9ACAR|nr:unnamed protein product [Oppiella nova]CAG2167502.1 unnamed protein product [Oppiella nova]